MSQLVLANILAGSGNVLAGGDNSGNVNKVTIGTNLTLSGGVLSAAGGGTGSVTSVAVSRSGDALSITGSPITTSGTINIGFAGTGAQYIKGDGTLATFPTTISQAQKLITEVYNETGATLTKGTVVYINGGHGNLPTVTKAIATGDATSAQTYGVVQSDITNNNNGFVVVIGSLTDMDTQAYTAGTQLYLSPTTAGAYTSVKQYAPAHLVYIGIVVRSHPTQGVIEIRIQNGFELDELHNVSAQTPSNGDILQYVSSTSLWTSVAGTTTNIAEGTNLYYTNARARLALSANTGSALTYNNTTGRFTLNAADSGTSGYLTAADWTDFDSKQSSLGTGTTSEFLRGDLVWATPPTPDLGDLGDVAITTPTNGQVLTYRVGTWKNETPTAAPVTSVFGRTGAVVATSGDYTTDQVTEGTTNLYYTNTRARAALSTNVGSALTYNNTTGRFTLNAADGTVEGYVTNADYAYWDAKQESIGTGTTSQWLRGDLTWSTVPAPALDDLTDVIITTPSNGQLLRYQAGNWINFTPTYISLTALSATAPLSYNSGTGVFSISQATTSTNGYLSSTDWNTFNGKQAQINGTGFVKASGTTISYDNSTYLTTSAAASTYLPLVGGTLTGSLTINYSTAWNAVSTNNGSGITTPQGAFFVNTYPTTSDRYYTQFSGNWSSAGTWGLGVRGSSDNTIYLARNNSGVLDITASVSLYIGPGLALHTSNYSSYALPLSGGTLTGTLNGTVGSFSSTMTASSFARIGGTSSQFLKGDGSVDTNTYVTGGPYLPLSGGTLSGILYGNGGGNFYIYNYARIGLPNLGTIIYNNGTGSNMFFGELAFDVYGFTGNASGDVATLAMNVSSRKVAINGRVPNAPLDVTSETTSSSGIQQWSYNSGPSSYRLQLNTIVSSGLVKYSFDMLNSGTSYSNNIVFDRGNIGFGTASPTYKIEVNGTGFFSSGINLATTVRFRWGGNNTPALGFPFGGSDTGNALFIEAADGDSGGVAICNDGVTVYGAGDTGFVFRAIDEDVYQSTSDVSASTNFYVNQGQNGGAYFRGSVTVNSGNVTASAFFESSDKRLKKELNNNPIVNGISDIKPKLYIKDGKEELGYYAQDLEQILPSAVTEGKDGFLALSYSQVLVAKVANLEGEVKELKEIVKTLINELGRNK